MGYSIAIRVSSEVQRKRMIAFMGKHYRKWSDVIEEGKSISSGEATDDLSYDHAKKALGFDYASHLHGWERLYVYSALRWMALKVGDRKRRFDKDTVDPPLFKKPVPFMVYDGYEFWPILVCQNEREALKLPKGQRWCSVDPYGVYISEKTSESIVTACEDLFLDKKLYAAFGNEVLKTIGQAPEESEARSRWIKKNQAIRAKHCKPEIKRMLPKVRAELSRLDQLWEG